MNEISTRTVSQITTEIITIKKQIEKVLLDSAIELGRRLCEVKELLPHGEWGKYLKDAVEFSQSTANNLMRLYEEFGDAQGSFFGATAKSQTFSKLTYSKAIALLAVPENEREDFIEQEDVHNKSTRELQKVIAERDTAKRASEKAEQEVQKLLDEQKQVLQQSQDRAAQAQAELERIQNEKVLLEQQLEELQIESDVPNESSESIELNEQLIENIRKETRDSFADELEKAVIAAKAEEKELLKIKFEKANQATEQAKLAKNEADVQLEKQKDIYEQEKASFTQKIEQLQKQLIVSNSNELAVFKIHFEAAQTAVNKMIESIGKVKNSGDESHSKLTSALKALCDGVLRNI